MTVADKTKCILVQSMEKGNRGVIYMKMKKPCLRKWQHLGIKINTFYQSREDPLISCFELWNLTWITVHAVNVPLCSSSSVISKKKLRLWMFLSCPLSEWVSAGPFVLVRWLRNVSAWAGLGWWHICAGLGRWAGAGHTTTASQQHNSNWPALSGPATSATTLCIWSKKKKCDIPWKTRSERSIVLPIVSC